MRIRNDGPTATIFGCEFVSGETVEMPADLSLEKQAWLEARFTVIPDPEAAPTPMPADTVMPPDAGASNGTPRRGRGRPRKVRW